MYLILDWMCHEIKLNQFILKICFCYPIFFKFIRKIDYKEKNKRPKQLVELIESRI